MKLPKSALTISLIILLCSALPRWGFADKGVEVENEGYRIKLLEKIEIQDKYIGQNRYKFIFSVYNKQTGRESVVAMENLTTDIGQAEIVKDRLLVFGGLDVICVTVIDLKQGREVDFFCCYGLQLSETKRYLIYQKFYYSHGMEQAQSDLILIYDLESSPEENRVEEKYKHSKEKSQYIGDPLYLVASEYVGHPIYPAENVTKQTYFVWVPAPEERHPIEPPGQYACLAQDSKVLFVDKYQGENWLVLVDLSQGLTKVESRKKLIDVTRVIDVDNMMALDRIADAETALREGKARIPIVGLRQSTEGKIVISIAPDMRYKVREIEMELP